MKELESSSQSDTTAADDSFDALKSLPMIVDISAKTDAAALASVADGCFGGGAALIVLLESIVTRQLWYVEVEAIVQDGFMATNIIIVPRRHLHDIIMYELMLC